MRGQNERKSLAIRTIREMALGHNSKVVHRGLREESTSHIAPLEEYERKIVPLPNISESELTPTVAVMGGQQTMIDG